MGKTYKIDNYRFEVANNGVKIMLRGLHDKFRLIGHVQFYSISE